MNVMYMSLPFTLNVMFRHVRRFAIYERHACHFIMMCMNVTSVVSLDVPIYWTGICTYFKRVTCIISLDMHERGAYHFTTLGVYTGSCTSREYS